MAEEMRATVIARRKPRKERLPDSSDAVDIALHAVATGKPLPDVARHLLEEQSRLVRAQTSELKTRQVGERVRAVLWAVLAIAAGAVLALVAALVVKASRTDALVVQSFRVPASMQARGLSGEVVATQLLDRLAEMQEQSESTRAASSYANNWENDLKIDIPNTGATAEQVWKLLRGWLGKETRISGEVIESKEGLALTARVGSQPGRRFLDADDDLDALVLKGADLIYAKTQPYRHAVYLMNQPDRKAERMAALQALTSHESPMERKWAYNGLSVSLRSDGDFRGALEMAKKALAIDPIMIPSIGNLGSAHKYLGHEQQMVDFFRRWSELEVGKEYDARIVAANQCQQRSETGATMRDPLALQQSADCLEASSSSMRSQAAWIRTSAALLRQDPAPALAFVQKEDRAYSVEEAAVVTLAMRLEGAILLGSGATLAKALDDYRKARDERQANSDSAAFYTASAPTMSWPTEARALLALRRVVEAENLIQRTPLDCYECVRVRGLVAVAQGQRSTAQLQYLSATKLGPRLPAAYADWGRLLAQAGRHRSAEIKFQQAVRLAPNWAEPLNDWGDMLLAQGKRKEALTKFNSALQLAPRWSQLRRKSDELSRKP